MPDANSDESTEKYYTDYRKKRSARKLSQKNNKNIRNG